MFARLLGVFLLAIVLPLAGCTQLRSVSSAVSTVAGISVPQKDVAAAVQSFNIAQKAATKYLLFPTCKPGQTTAINACKTAGGVALLGRDLKAGRAARDKLWAAATSSPGGVGPKALVTAVIAAVSALNADIAK